MFEMDFIVELIAYVILAVVGVSVVYHMLPFKLWQGTKPSFVFFPKYQVPLPNSMGTVKSTLEVLHFEQVNRSRFSRGKVFGDFSSRYTKLVVELDEENKEMRISSAVFGVLFDTGDIWQLAQDIVKSD